MIIINHIKDQFRLLRQTPKGVFFDLKFSEYSPQAEPLPSKLIHAFASITRHSKPARRHSQVYSPH
ncbi:hypothetical protein CCL08_14980 [Pseudomonas congelans]|nr:hypothetical protein CCL08_14980 [Pseudomonas congelans]